MDVDLLITGGNVIDGTGGPGFPAQVGVRAERIVAVSRHGDGSLRGGLEVDASGLVVAPGFIDSNTHADWAVLDGNADSLLAPMLLQGVTTVVGGGCGFSPSPVAEPHFGEWDALTRFLHDGELGSVWGSFGDFADACDRCRPLVNVALMVGQQAARCAVVGVRPGPLDDRERAELGRLLREALEAGAVGVSANFGFVPGVYADVEEQRVLAQAAAAADVVLAVHARAYSTLSTAYRPWPRPPHNIRAIRELTALAAQTGVRLQVSHVGLAGRRSWPLVDAVLEEVEDSRRAGGDIGFDVVPYPLGVGPLQMVFPPWAVQELQQGPLRRRTRSRLRLLAAVQPHLLGLGFDDVELLRSADHRAAAFAGLDFTQIGRRLGQSPIDAQITVASQSRLGTAVALGCFSGDETDESPLEALLAHRDAAVVSNAAFSTEGVPNPAAHGAFPRLLGRFVRERRTLTLEEAVRRATALPAERLGVAGIGRITEGAAADLVLLDPATVDDGGWPERPAGPPCGIHTVIVGGRVAAQQGTVVSVGNGRLLHR